MDEYALYGLVLAYVFGTLTIPLWVPIVKRLTGDCGVFWVRLASSLDTSATDALPAARWSIPTRCLTGALLALPAPKRMLSRAQVFSTLTYYAYLAWLVFAALQIFLLLRWPAVGIVWLIVLAVRMLNFARLRSRGPRRAHEVHARDGRLHPRRQHDGGL